MISFATPHSNMKQIISAFIIGIAVCFITVKSCSDKPHQVNIAKIKKDIKFENNQKTFHVIERQILLKILIDYYTIHLDGFRKPKSLDVLKEVFT